MKTLVRLLTLTLALGLSSALNNGLALTPPMGWLSWERFRCEVDCQTYPDSCISEGLYMRMADKMVELGLKDAGYEYVNIDDCWPMKERDPATGKLVPDPDRFPSGIKALADFMHTRGLKLGIYQDFGVQTCGKYPGSEFYMELDANTFADWNVDSVKFDGCNSNPNDMAVGYPTMGMYLNKTGRPMLYSCEWPLYLIRPMIKANYTAIRQACNLWRNYHDVQDSWDSVKDIIAYYSGNPDGFSNFSGPGGWADPDMLVTGDFGLSYYQQRAQFGMWAMFAAPLYISAELGSISAEALAILKNKDVIAVNQDPLGVQARMVMGSADSVSAWVKPLSGGSSAVALLNPEYGGRPSPFSTSLGALGLTNANGYNVTELFDGMAWGEYKLKTPVTVMVDPTGIRLFKAVPL